MCKCFTGRRLVSNYPVLSRALHRLVLGSKFVSRLAYDVELTLFQPSETLSDAVYITGLARAGTTSMLQAIYSSGEFASLTYRDMPFVLAPNLWSLSESFSRSRQLQERIHGDGIFENSASPASLEEPFWINESSCDYSRLESIPVQDVPPEVVSKLNRYHGIICRRYNKRRYLAKNNNLIVRLHSLAPQLNNTIFLVLFRDPIAHANSLLSQHFRLSNPDKFTQAYMRWLGHHEFGAGHRPYLFPHNISVAFDRGSVDYWVARWVDAYGYLLNVIKNNPSNIIPVQYERVCDDYAYRRNLFERLSIVGTSWKFINKNSRSSLPSADLRNQATAIYEVLCTLAAA
jgi:hypothetical protein